MAKYTIIDWQRDGLMVAVGQSHGSSVTLEQISEQPIEPIIEGQEAPRNGDAAQALSRATDELGLRKSDVTVVASRELVEVRTISVPRIDEAELPDVIRFQAQRQLANMGENWTLDYVMLPDEPEQEMHTALVGVISPTVLNELESACAKAGLQLVHIALRPIEIARFATSSGKLAAGASVVVCVSEQQADLMILNNGHVVQVRSTRLPSEESRLATSLAGELRRSLMAASSQLGNKPVTSAIIFAGSELATRVRTVVADTIGCNVSVIDPIDLLPKSLEHRQQLCRTSANRIAGLAGAINFAGSDAKMRIDFKNPKKRPPPRSKTVTYLLAAAATLMVALAGVSWWVSTNRALNDELAFYQSEIESKKGDEKVAQQRIKDLIDIEQFLEGSPNWLDELAYLSEKIPPSHRVVVDPPTFNIQPDGTGRITMPVYADSRTTISEFEKSLRDEHHVVAAKKTDQLDAPVEPYGWKADESISVIGRGWKLVSQIVAGRAVGESKPAAGQSGTTDSAEEPANGTMPLEAVPGPDENKRASNDADRPAI